MSLKKQAISGMIWTYSQQFGSQLITFVVSLVLTRLILPEEFGLIGMIAIFMGIGTALFDGGLTSSLIRSKDLNQDDYSTVFYFNFAGSVIMYLILFFIAPLIAKFYHQPALIKLTRVYGITFILAAFGAVQNTILTSELKFKKQAMISLPAIIISSSVGLWMAYYDYGVWSLVGTALINALLTSLFLWFSSSWYPTITFSKEKFRKHFHYGYKLTLSSVLDIIFTNIYQIVIGRFYSAAQVGYYTRANTLMMLPVGNVSAALNRVVFPLFAQVQNDIPRFKKAYKQIMQMVLFIITPVIVIMAFLAEPLILFLFGQNWLPVVPIFQIICFTGILYPIHLYNLLVLQVKGRSDLFLKLEVAKKILLSVILAISFFFGFYALLWGQLIFSIVALIINTHFAGNMLMYKTSEQLKDIFPIFLLIIPMGSILLIFNYLLTEYNLLIQLFVGASAGAISYFGIAWLFKFETINDIKNLIKKNDTSN
ncbi:capsule biosynthesis protein CapK [Chryseobacterium sp. Leaf404]|uniref:lipopolysaccharide biosynthesis protein n=1 Tax=unclassified Chryseobacterium TaxID=2593645 RepID=UPI0006FEEF07|nr:MULTISPECIES: lipopolysaccharide biosynthesis protein [unclassified Chryseobacterium]KQT17869.1 capsule biosynthesis protein CapK [Chryseobacterium sp. Leaf404]